MYAKKLGGFYAETKMLMGFGFGAGLLGFSAHSSKKVTATAVIILSKIWNALLILLEYHKCFCHFSQGAIRPQRKQTD